MPQRRRSKKHPSLRRGKQLLSSLRAPRSGAKQSTITTPWFLYIVECQDKTLYTGITTDITRRVKEHNAKRGAFYTKNKTPVKLVYQESVGNCRAGALKREFQIKRLPREKKLILVRHCEEAEGRRSNLQL